MLRELQPEVALDLHAAEKLQWAFLADATALQILLDVKKRVLVEQQLRGAERRQDQTRSSSNLEAT